jgi:predicted RNA-binding Zn ribbon-like protein
MSEGLPPPIFVADAVSIDFLNSIATPVDTQIEWIGSGEDFLAWLREADLVPPEVISRLRKSVVPGEFDIVASQARNLREWFRGFVQAHMGKPLKPKALQDLEPLNRILARDEESGRVVAREVPRRGKSDEDGDERPMSGLEWRPQRRWQSPDALLFPVARAMADLICEDDFTQVKACQGHNCTLMFVDRTRGHARRWCSMAVCGNRAKQAAHRERIAGRR